MIVKEARRIARLLGQPRVQWISEGVLCIECMDGSGLRIEAEDDFLVVRYFAPQELDACRAPDNRRMGG